MTSTLPVFDIIGEENEYKIVGMEEVENEDGSGFVKHCLTEDCSLFAFPSEKRIVDKFVADHPFEFKIKKRGVKISGILMDVVEKTDFAKLIRLANGGGAKEQTEVAKIFEKKEDFINAGKYYEKAVAQGFPEAQVALGVLIEGENPRRAMELYKASAESGYDEGTEMLATMKEYGIEGDFKDEKEAVRLYESIVGRRPIIGIPLGKMYEEGRGVAQNFETAMRYYELANTYMRKELKAPQDVSSLRNLQKMYDLRRVNETKCSICLESFAFLTENFCSTKCGHSFHFDCLMEVLSGRASQCPICRAELGFRCQREGVAGARPPIQPPQPEHPEEVQQLRAFVDMY
jgi:tetratricopeptide (TPR) repeat protein